MKTLLLKISVSRKTLKKKSQEQPVVKRSSRNAVEDKNFYQKAVEALYETLDPLRLIFLIFAILKRRFINLLKIIFLRKVKLKC